MLVNLECWMQILLNILFQLMQDTVFRSFLPTGQAGSLRSEEFGLSIYRFI